MATGMLALLDNGLAQVRRLPTDGLLALGKLQLSGVCDGPRAMALGKRQLSLLWSMFGDSPRAAPGEMLGETGLVREELCKTPAC